MSPDGVTASLPPPGTVENRQARRSWRATAWISGGFTLLVGLGLGLAHIQHKSSDPWRSPALLELKERLRVEPGNEALKQQIRSLDLQLRQRYFRLLSLKATGVYLLIGGTLVCLHAGCRVRQLNRRPPMPQPDPHRIDRLDRHARWSRTAVAALSGLGLAGLGVLGMRGARSPLADAEHLATLRGLEGPASAVTRTVPVEALQTNWPRFRGHQGAGVAGVEVPLATVPVVRWQVPALAAGFNSPVVWGDRVFFTGGDATLREAFCLSATSGALQWRQRVEVAAPPSAEAPREIPDMTGYAASTAATDGERLYVLFATGELAAFTLEGGPLWSMHLGTPDNPYGQATSLALWQDQVVVQLDQGDEESRKSRILAIQGRSGEVCWQKPRPVGASWATPIVIEAAGQPQIVTLGLPWVIAYQPQDGAELWRARLLEGEITPSPVFAADRLFIVDPGMGQLLAVRSEGRGDVTGTHVAWRVDGDMPDITSPVCDGERVFTLTTDGRLSCFSAGSGGRLWLNEIKAGGEFQASPSLVGTNLLLVSAAGDLIAIEAAEAFVERWRTRLEDEFHASPAFANGRIYLRGRQQVWCLGGGPTEVAQP